jgi:hypothetical protein
VSKSRKHLRFSSKNVVHTTIVEEHLLAPKAPSECTDAVLLAEERYERQTQGRAQDRIAALTNLTLARIAKAKTLAPDERHFVLAFMQGETMFDERWNLGGFLENGDDHS